MTGQASEPWYSSRGVLSDVSEVCIGVCPFRAIRFKDTVIDIDRTKCTLCGECVKVCAPEALSIIGRWMTVEEVLEEVERDRVFYEASRGGVTVSGGEPFAQPGFTEAFLKACKVRGIATAVETAGYASWHTLEPIIPYLDFILYDIKHINPLRHRQLTGVSNKRTLENARKIAGRGLPISIRYTVIPGFNDDPQDREALFRFIETLPGVKHIDLLPYHRLGESKYTMLGRDYALRQVKTLARQDLEGWVQGAQQRNLEVHIIV